MKRHPPDRPLDRPEPSLEDRCAERAREEFIRAERENGMTTTMTGPVKFGDTFLCSCGEDLELEDADPFERTSEWSCPNGHRWIRDLDTEDGQPEWKWGESE